MNPGFQYLKDRGLTSKTLQVFHMAYYDGAKFYGHSTTLNSPFISSFQTYLCSYLKKVTDEKGKHRWDDCVIFPVLDLYGKPVAFFARRLNGKPKFDATTFAKAEILFGLHQTCSDVVDKGSIFITEGIFDFMMLWQQGVRNCTCSMGVSLTFEQLCLAARFTSNFNIVYDPDRAGKAGAAKVRRLIQQHNYNCKNIILDELCDLDEYLIKYGVQRFLRYAKDSGRV